MNVRKESGTMNRRLKHIIFYPLLTILAFAVAASADPVSQDITLDPGWNAIFIEVEPADTTPSVVFSTISDLQSVWEWNHRAGTVEFIQNPDQLVTSEPRMLVYIPDGLPGDAATNLSAIQGNKAYLVKIDSVGSQILTITGEPKIPYYQWKSNSFNLVGFHLSDSPKPIFGDFFSSSPAHDGQTIFRLDNPSGTWQEVISADTMEPGEAFWVYCNGSSNFNGPVSATLEMASGLHFGTKLAEQELYLNNNSDDVKTITLTLPTLPPPLNGTIHYWVFDVVDQVASWQLMPLDLPLTVAPGDSQRVRIGVKRTGLTADTDYQTNIGVSDGEGVNFLLPLSVTGINYTGLWTGYAMINKVSDVNKVDGEGLQDMTELPTGSEFDFRLILHADEGGPVRLLSQVIQMWQEGTLKPDPDNLGQFVVDDPGHFILFTDETLIDSFEGSLLRDGQQIGRRISAPAFPRLADTQENMTVASESEGVFPQPGHIREIEITLASDDATNPFFHMFHKTHGLAVNSLTVTRNITLSFADEDEDGNPITGLVSLNRGSSEIGGIYRETISGLNKFDITIEGRFVLHRVSNVATLTTE